MDWVNTSPLVRTYTLDEFWDLTEPPDYSKVELIAGILYLTPGPNLRHSNNFRRLIRIMSGHLLTTHDQGRLYVPRAGICGTPNTWLEPDFFYVGFQTEARLNGKYHTTADLVVEVISPESAVYDRNTKADTYFALKVRELWLVDELFGVIEVRGLRDGCYQSNVFGRDDLLRSTVLPSLEFRVRKAFED